MSLSYSLVDLHYIKHIIISFKYTYTNLIFQELSNENKILRAVQKKQEIALQR